MQASAHASREEVAHLPTWRTIIAIDCMAGCNARRAVSLQVLCPAVLLPSWGARTTSEIVDTLIGLVVAVSMSVLTAKPPQALRMP